MQKDVQLTVFTPAYNRADTLERCYKSLQRQSNKGFEWLIIDDGSTDDTAEIVKQWQSENDDFKIRYFYKNNGGLHTAYNKAIENMDGKDTEMMQKYLQKYYSSNKTVTVSKVDSVNSFNIYKFKLK